MKLKQSDLNNLKTQFDYQVYNKNNILDQLSSHVGYNFNLQIWNRIRSKVTRRVGFQVRRQFENQIKSQIYEIKNK